MTPFSTLEESKSTSSCNYLGVSAEVVDLDVVDVCMYLKAVTLDVV